VFDRAPRVRCFALAAAMAAWWGAAAPAAAAPSVEELIRQAFGGDAPLMLRVAWCESRLDPGARNPRSTARGVFQLVWLWGTEAERLDAATNVRIAKRLFDRSGTRPWKASERCWGGVGSGATAGTGSGPGPMAGFGVPGGGEVEAARVGGWRCDRDRERVVVAAAQVRPDR
jgi:hypothetical protein